MRRLTVALVAATATLGLSLSFAGNTRADVPATCTEDLLGMTCTVEVLAGLTCNAGGWTTCTNTTNTDYTVIETVDCPAGSFIASELVPMYDALTGTNTMTPQTVTHYVEASVEHSSIFVPANNTGTGPQGTGCDGGNPTSIRYSIEGP